jgi:hypothetical protein
MILHCGHPLLRRQSNSSDSTPAIMANTLPAAAPLAEASHHVITDRCRALVMLLNRRIQHGWTHNGPAMFLLQGASWAEDTIFNELRIRLQGIVKKFGPFHV